MVVPRAGDDVLGRLRHADLAAFAVDGPFRLAVGHKMGIIYARHLPYLLLAEKPFGHKTLAPHPVHEGRHGLFLVDGKGHHSVGPHIVGELSLQYHRAVAIVAVRGHGGFVRHDLAATAGAVIGHLRAVLFGSRIRAFACPLPFAGQQLVLLKGRMAKRALPLPAIGIKVQIAAAAGAFIGDAGHVFTSFSAVGSTYARPAIIS